jgi:hypothetical protein
VLVQRYDDVTGDGVVDEVNLVGTPVSEGGFTQDITLMIKNGKTGRITQVALKNNAGYDPTIFLCDFTGDGVKNIKVSINSGGSGGFYYVYIYSFANNQLRLLFDGDMYMASKEFQASYADGYVVVVADEGLGLTFRIDVSNDPAATDLYDQDGQLEQPTSANVSPFINAMPIVLDESKGTCDLQVLTRVWGQFAADTLGYIQDYIQWENGSWRTVREDLAVQPSVSGDN